MTIFSILISACLLICGIYCTQWHDMLDSELARGDPRNVDYFDYMISGYGAVLSTLTGIVYIILFIVYVIW